METTARVGRNEPCPCGSGKKYKACCEGRIEVVAESQRASNRFIGVAIVVLLVAGVAALFIFREDEPAPKTTATNVILPTTPPALATTTTTITPPSTGTPAPQPPGPVPLGKVWSADHGHWHDAPGTASPNAPMPLAMGPGMNAMPTPTAAPATFTPQPAGPVPDGKVWSTEHGHWHDAAPAAPTPQ